MPRRGNNRKLPLIRRDVTEDDPLRVLTIGAIYWPFPRQVYAWLDTLLFVLGEPSRLEVWHSDSTNSIDQIVNEWFRRYAPNGVRRRIFYTSWKAPCRSDCRHRPRKEGETCRAAAHYRDARMIEARPDLCIAWLYATGTLDVLHMARRAGIPCFTAPISEVGIDRFALEPVPLEDLSSGKSVGGELAQ